MCLGLCILLKCEYGNMKFFFKEKQKIQRLQQKNKAYSISQPLFFENCGREGAVEGQKHNDGSAHRLVEDIAGGGVDEQSRAVGHHT